MPEVEPPGASLLLHLSLLAETGEARVRFSQALAPSPPPAFPEER